MPTISVSKTDLENLLQTRLQIQEIESLLPLVKGELKSIEGDELRIELADSNRPDLLCIEGIARNIRANQKLKSGATSSELHPAHKVMCGTDLFSNNSEFEIIVSPDLYPIRPYIGGFIAKGTAINELSLLALIQAQEKISELFGRNRRNIAIGMYNARKIKFPVFYKAVLPDERKFVPLGFDKEVTLNEILTLHPKGKEYAYILENIDKYPFLEDSQGAPLSFPPIINSRLTGEVCVGDDELFCELTGTDIEQLLLVVNIFAENLKDRGAKIYPCATKYPYSTPFGDNIITPYDFKLNIKLNPTELNKLLGTDFSVSKIKLHLEAMGYTLSCQEETPDSTKNDKIIVSVPSYRRDVMHPVDIIEDFAISVGYNYFKPTPLTEFTVGKTTSIQPLISKVRNIMIGSGFEEVISNILTSKSILFSNIGITNEEVVEVQNPVSESYTVLRNSIIPILLNIEAKNSQSAYPHHIFEIGEVVVPDANSPTKFRTEFKVSALICHASANFSELHSFMDTLLYYLGIPYKIDKISHPSFITGRVGNIITECAGNVGIIGEIHPAVLDNLKIKCPVATFELPLNFSLDSLQDIAI